MKRKTQKNIKVGQTIIIGRCANYEFYYDDLTKGHLCHDWKMRKCKCGGNIFKMLACPFYEKPINGKFKVKVTKEDVQTFNDELQNVEQDSKNVETAERNLYEALKRKYGDA